MLSPAAVWGLFKRLYVQNQFTILKHSGFEEINRART
jgi:hypothetical protein